MTANSLLSSGNVGVGRNLVFEREALDDFDFFLALWVDEAERATPSALAEMQPRPARSH